MKIFIQLLLVLLSWLPLHAILVLSQPNHGETAFSEFTTHINDYAKVTEKNLRLAGDAADNMKLVLGKTGEHLAQITDKGLIRLKNSVIPPIFTVLLDMGQLPVKFGDEFLEAEVKIVKYGDEVGVVVEKVDDLASFVNKTLTQKLDEITTIWNTKYPVQEMLEGRSFFEDIMGYYRYAKSSGWSHTGDISEFFKGVDFYKGTLQGSNIFAETAVSMKTTITTNVDNWLASAPVQKNIGFLTDGLNPTKGLQSNSKLMFIQNAEIHIYMPKANITNALKTTWMNKLNTVNPKIKFEIKALEDFVN